MPTRWLVELKRIYFGWQIRKGIFLPHEPEYELLPQLITPGDWVVDIGANVGHYTKRFSELAGAKGRVIAFEPVPATFFLLSANVEVFVHPNVTLINAAVSDRTELVGMTIPKFSSGLTNYYRAALVPGRHSELSVLTLSLDSFCFYHRLALIKIDTEGHEKSVLSGMEQVLKNCRPILIIETSSGKIIDKLSALGYIPNKLKNSPNILFIPS